MSVTRVEKAVPSLKSNLLDLVTSILWEFEMIITFEYIVSCNYFCTWVNFVLRFISAHVVGDWNCYEGSFLHGPQYFLFQSMPLCCVWRPKALRWVTISGLFCNCNISNPAYCLTPSVRGSFHVKMQTIWQENDNLVFIYRGGGHSLLSVQKQGTKLSAIICRWRRALQRETKCSRTFRTVSVVQEHLKSLLGNSKFHTSASALQMREKALPSRKQKKSAIQHNNWT